MAGLIDCMRKAPAFVAFLFLVSCSPDPAELPRPVAVTTSGAGPAKTAQVFGAMLNAERAKHGRPKLNLSPQLSAAALGHAIDMATKKYFSHTSRGGVTPADRVLAQGYSYCFVAENIAQGQKTEAAVLAGWMRSSGHRRNNLSRDATQYGFAHAPGDYWVLVLGRPGC